MPQPAPSQSAGAASGRAWLLPILLGVAVALPEMVLLGADLGLWGSAFWRPRAYQYGGFWVGLLRDWQPNYALQPALMFLSYAFLHAGPGHLAGNMLVILPLGRELAAWMGRARGAWVALASALGGAAAFGILSRNPAPMVGASGLAFGLAGALVARRWTQGDRWTALALAAGLAAVNLAMWVLMERVAWQSHAGGAIAGAGAALLLRPARTDGPGTPPRAAQDPEGLSGEARSGAVARPPARAKTRS